MDQRDLRDVRLLGNRTHMLCVCEAMVEWVVCLKRIYGMLIASQAQVLFYFSIFYSV